MNREPPAHKQTDPAKMPGQIVNSINFDMMDDMAGIQTPSPSALYKPAHGGYPGEVHTAEERQALKLVA